MQIHVLFGTESNNTAELAERTGKALEAAGFTASVVDMGAFQESSLPKLETVLVITSTYGNGDPPGNAEALHAFLMKKCPPLASSLRFSVCALGDHTYDRFCQCGKDFDRRLAELGATRLADRQDCDVDFEAPWKLWLDRVLGALAEAKASSPRIEVAATAVEEKAAAPGTRRNPVLAEVIARRPLTKPGSTKEALHVELSIAGDLARKALYIAPAAAVGVGVWRGWDAAWAVLAALAIVCVNFAGSAALMRWGARRAPELLMGVVLGSFIGRLAVVTAVGVGVKELDVVDWPVFCIALVVAHLGLLAWETRAVSLTLAYPGLKPRHGQN